MRTGARDELPAGLDRLRRRFERWRRTRIGRPPTPDHLWESAVKAAGTYGLHRTAKALRVNYYALKKRVALAGGDGNRVGGPQKSPRNACGRHIVSAGEEAVATFLELTPPASGKSCECIVELENPEGAKMRVHLKGAGIPDLVALSHSFWRMGA